MFDVIGLAAEARPTALAAAEVYYRHTTPWFIGLVCFGSAVRGDIVPGVSDLDFHLYLDPAAFACADGDDNILPPEPTPALSGASGLVVVCRPAAA